MALPPSIYAQQLFAGPQFLALSDQQAVDELACVLQGSLK